MYTLETLTEINQRFVGSHFNLMQSDVDMANKHIEVIEKSRSKETPKIGDIVRYTNKYGEYYHSAMIDSIDGNDVVLCERGSSYISLTEDEKDILLSTSGGSFPHTTIDKFKYIGTTERRFWRFGHCGACADGGIEFYAKVNVWECDINEQEFSTKTHDKYYVSYSKESFGINYHFSASNDATSSHAWRNEQDLQAWLRTFRAKIQKGNGVNSFVAWTYKHIEHQVSPSEYEKINGIEDVMCCNGNRKCKRVYEDENFTVHTYFVWYWEDDSIEDWRERSIIQNELRKQWEVHYSVPVNIYAHEEIRQKKSSPLDIWQYIKKD